MDELERDIDAIAAESQFSGAVRIDRGGDVVVERAYGLARRDTETPNTPATQFGTASALKNAQKYGMMAGGVVSQPAVEGMASLPPARRKVRP